MEIGFVWVCFFTVNSYPLSDIHLGIKELGRFRKIENWVCFADLNIFLATD